MHNSTSRPETRHTRRRHRGGALGAAAIVASALSVILPVGATTVAAVAEPSLPLQDGLAGSSAPACPDGGFAAWHFVLDPADGTRRFASISLDLDGATYTFTDSMIVPNGGRTDDVFVAVPPGRTLASLVIERSTATTLPAGVDVSFLLVDACDGAVPDTATSSASSAGAEPTEPTEPADTVEATTVATDVPPIPCSDEPGDYSDTPACPPSTGVEPICVELSAVGDVVRGWYRITNEEAMPVTYDWVDGSVSVEPAGSVTISTSDPSLVLAVDGVETAVADAPGSPCTVDVEVTKTALGPEPDGATYQFVVSQLVGDAAVPVGAPVEIRSGETVTVAVPSTLDPAGIVYAVTEVDPGAAAIATVTPGSFVVSGYGGEPIGVTITNAYPAIALDKQVSQTSDLEPGDRLLYTLTATNTGAVTLDPVMIVDRLPASVTYRLATIVGGTGSCTLVEALQPQLVRCAITGAVVPGASAPTIRLEVVVDDDAAGTEIVNQAVAIGSYSGGPVTSDPAAQARMAGAALDDGLSCDLDPGAVCALSARVSSGVVLEAPPTTVQESEGPVPTTSSTTATTTSTTTPSTTVVVASAGPVAGTPTLPSTGTGIPRAIALASVMVLTAGVALLLGSRRSARAT